MKLSKFSLLLILVASILVLNGASESADVPKTKLPTSPDDQKAEAQKQSTTTQTLPPSTGAPTIIINNPAPAVE